MERRYKQLSLQERDRITELKAGGFSLRAIAEALGRSPSTVAREVERNSSPAYMLYMSHRAHDRAVKRKEESAKRPRLKDKETESYVLEKLSIGWSPEQIAGRIGMERPGLSISHEAIYQYIYHPKTEGREYLIRCLRRGHRKRKVKGVGRKERKTKIPNRIPIEERPLSADNRSRFGHWEGDSLVSRKSLVALNTLVERKSRLLLITRLDRKSAEQTSETVKRRLGGLPKSSRRTLTLDNGSENAGHQEITEAIGTRCYFARPYASWQRGTNEHMNGLVRWYFPKGTDFGKITDEQVARVESLINTRPRKCLGYKTPLEVASVALRG
ncbi:MAG: IS30 family transposase [Thermodesulfovibrionales bacterium]|nr:IS30 family transposase [Thermodesulfovibrionales bacterium]